MKRTLLAPTVTLILGGLLALGCATPGATPSPIPSPTPGVTASPAPSPTPTPTTVEVTSAAQAAALVFAHEGIPRMGPLLPDLIGQSAWYEATQSTTGYTVAITVGRGDCQAGCIERHTWTYDVSRAGEITLVSDEGDEVAIPPAEGTAAPLTLRVLLTAGPTCPVAQNPPDPNCAPRPVVNAEVLVFNTNGEQVASGTSAADGSILLQLPAGAYYADPQPVEGLLGKVDALAFAGVGGDTVGLTFGYDTGIR